MLQLSFVNFKQGSYILVEGKLDVNQFYIIQSGSVKCYRRDNVETPDILGSGDFIGVISCMSGKPQIENAIAQTNVVCIAVRKDQYSELIQQNTPIAIKIIRTFAARMRVMNNQLATMNSSSGMPSRQTIAPTSDQIFNVGVFYDRKKLYNIAYFCYFQFIKSGAAGKNVDIAKRRLVMLKPYVNVPYLVPTSEIVREYPKDTMIMCEAQSGNEMFIIQEGNVKISKVINDEEVTLALLKKGDMFGEMALLENKPRSATAIAHDDCKLMTVNRQNFNQMVATQAQLVSRLTTTFAERLWSMSRQVSNAKLSDPLSKLIDMISIQIEKSKTPIAKDVSFNCELTAEEIGNMCGVTEKQMVSIYPALMSYNCLKVAQGDKILVKDTQEIVKEAAVRRKQLSISKN